MNYAVEITRNNVTPAKFFAEIRFALKNKGIDFGIDFEDFINPIQQSNTRYLVNESTGKCSCYAGDYSYITDAKNMPCKSEICRTLPYDWQTYVLNFDGSMYNEICEFTFDDEKTGHGYYYQANRD